MKILVLGGTRFFGIHLVKDLLEKGHEVTIATRGKMPDPFGDKVKRLKVDRTDINAMKDTFDGKEYDMVYDDIAYSSNDVKCALENITCSRYVLVSTISVYDSFHMDIKEEEYDPYKGEIIWCNREDFTYNIIKQQAEKALFQEYKNQSSIAVRFPLVIGKDDYTERLLFYVEHVKKEIPMYIDNLEEELVFIHSEEAGKFLSFLSEKDYTGILNASSQGTLTLKEIISYVEEKTGKTALLSTEGEAAPYNFGGNYSILTERADKLGYPFTKVRDFVFDILDYYIAL
jgi:nucleoside-diphosphate-sugar epimerase